MSKTPKGESLLNSSLGRELDADECQTLAGIMGVRNLEDGEILVKEGDHDDNLYLLAEGRLMVSSDLNGKEVTVYNLKAGEIAGTRAFVDHTPRHATLKSVGASTLYTLDTAAFERLLETHPRVVYKVMRGLFRTTYQNLMRMNLEAHELSNYISKTGGRY